jgi:hypothetical protein
MSPILDLRGIATRIAGLIAGQDLGDVPAMAARLGVNADALRRSVDPQAPRPSLDVLVAVVRRYGVDPSWLLYGEYDWSIHAESLEQANTLTSTDFLRLAESPRFVHPDEPPDQRLGAQLDS